MSAFNPHNYKTSAAVWQEIAKDTNEETGAQFTIIGGVVLGLFAAAAASPVTGLLFAGYFGFKAWQDTQAANRNEAAIDSYGCVAHLLKAGDLRDYARQVGTDAAVQEITWALENGYRVSSPALDLLESQGVDVDALVGSPALPAAKVEEPAAPGQTHDDELEYGAIELSPAALQKRSAKGVQAAVYLPATQIQRPAVAPNLSAHADVKQRMQALLEALAAAGCPLGSLLNHPFVWCWGRSQSGKTSIALLLAMARMALGHRVSYFTTDDDYPRILRWQRVEDSPEGYAVAIDDVASTISQATKGGLMGQGWVFDELYAASATHSIKIQPLLTCILMKGAKTRGGAIGISQADTSTAHGLKGIDAAWREERVSIQAIHHEDAQGNRAPTGRYQVQQGDDVQTWQLPQWMLTERNQRSDVDPIAWMLKQFPELKQATAEHQNARAKLEQLYRFNPEIRPETISTPDETTETAKLGGETVETPHTASDTTTPNTGVSGFVSGSVSGETISDIAPQPLRDRVRRVVEMRRNEMNQTQIIAIEWGLKPGDSNAYRDAVAEYKMIVEGL